MSLRQHGTSRLSVFCFQHCARKTEHRKKYRSAEGKKAAAAQVGLASPQADATKRVGDRAATGYETQNSNSKLRTWH
jgi:hypothetical protein